MIPCKVGCDLSKRGLASPAMHKKCLPDIVLIQGLVKEIDAHRQSIHQNDSHDKGVENRVRGDSSQDSSHNLDAPPHGITLANYGNKSSINTVLHKSRVPKCLQSKQSKGDPYLHHLDQSHPRLLHKALSFTCDGVNLELPMVGVLDHSYRQMRDKPRACR